MPIVSGRSFTRDDGPRNVVLLNQTAAGRFWKDANPVGKLVTTFNKKWEVVGTVKDAYTTSLGTVEPMVYFPMAGGGGIPQLLVADSTPATFERITSLVRQIEPRGRITFLPL